MSLPNECVECKTLRAKISQLEEEISKWKNKKIPVMRRTEKGTMADGWYTSGCVFCGAHHGCGCK